MRVMIRNTQIVKVNDSVITVRFGNSAACKDCNCMFKGFSDLDFDASSVKCPPQIVVGDVAVIDIPDRNVVLAPFAVFGFPLLALGLGLLLGSLWGFVVQALLMVSLLICSIFALYVIDKSVKSRLKFRMSLKEVVSQSTVDASLEGYFCESK